MKALRFFFLSILAAFSFAASAQTIEVYKDGRVIDSFSATQVDSVVYAPAAAQPRYYYYAGWDCPTSVETDDKYLVKLVNEANGTVSFGGKVTMEQIKQSTKTNPILDTEQRGDKHERTNWYVCIPNDLEIYDDILGQIEAVGKTGIEYEPVGSGIDIEGTHYNIFKSLGTSTRLWYIIIAK